MPEREYNRNFQEHINRLFLMELERTVNQNQREIEEELRAQGFNGLKAYYFDEDEWPFPTPSWTPKQFNQMWDLFTHDEKVRYVKSLIL